MKETIRRSSRRYVCDEGPRDPERCRHRPIFEGRLPTESEWSLTVLRSAKHRLTKLVERDGQIIPVDRAYFFAATPVDMASFDDAVEVLRELNFRPDCVIVLGSIAGTADRTCMRRLSKPDHENSDPATLHDCPRRLFPLDVDSVDAPEGLDRSDLASAAKAARDALPAPFRRAACIAVATSGYLLKDGLRFRLWFYLDKPMTCAAMKQWLRYMKARIDFSPLQPAGLNYTAAPIFDDPSHDPLPNGRIVVLDGTESVATPDMLDKPEMRQRVSSRSARRLKGGTSALIRAIVTIRGAEKGDRHNTIIRAAHRLADEVEQGSVSEEDADACLRDAGARLGMPNDETTAMSRHALARKRERFSFKDERQK